MISRPSQLSAEPIQPASEGATVITPKPSDSDRSLSIVCWTSAATLLSFLCLAHLGVMACFVAGARVSPLVAPGALLLSLCLCDWIARREGLRGLRRIIPAASVLIISALALFLAAAFYDMSWDSLWYQQTAVFQMAQGWNPLRDPGMHDFSPRYVANLVCYYSKGPWYVALALFQITHNIEWAKAATWAAFAAMFFAAFGAAIDFRLTRRNALVIAALVSFNPVVVCELASYMTDGLLASFLACYVAALFAWFRKPGPLVRVVMVGSAILCINSKLNALVYFCFALAAAGLYVLLKQRERVLRFILIQSTALLLGAVVLGWNPYVTNTADKGNPFFPLLGTGTAQGAKDNPIDKWETPRNLVGRSRLIRLGYALFGHPGEQPIFGGKDAQLMWPFNVRWQDFQIFYSPETRIAGFGPLFSGAFLISLGLLGFALAPRGAPRAMILLFLRAIGTSLMVSVHTWWARFAPQLWWWPILAVVAAFTMPSRPLILRAAWGLTAILLVNSAVITIVHFRWEIEAARTARAQLAELRQMETLDVDFQAFRVAYAERLRAAGVQFREVSHLSPTNSMELFSVAPGYHHAVRARVH